MVEREKHNKDKLEYWNKRKEKVWKVENAITVGISWLHPIFLIKIRFSIYVYSIYFFWNNCLQSWTIIWEKIIK